MASEASDVEFIRRKDYENFGAHFTAETARAHEVAATRAGNGGSLVARMEALQGACGAAPTFFIDELVLAEHGVTDMAQYAQPGYDGPLAADFFVSDEILQKSVSSVIQNPAYT